MNNQKVKLTNKLVNGFKSNTFTADGKKGKPYFIQEETAPGLNLRVQPTWKDKQGNEFQGTKTWIFRHHSRRDKNVKDWKIGRAGDITLEKAKQEVSALKVKLAKGIEPSVERKKKEAEEVLGSLVKKYCQTHLTVSNGFRENTITGIKDCFRVWIFRKTKDLSCIKRFIDKDISKLKITKVDRDLIREIHKSIGSTGKTYAANRFVAYLKMFFTWAIENKYFEKENPCKIKKELLFPEKRYDGRLTSDERERVYDNAILIDHRSGRLNLDQYALKSLRPVESLLAAFQLASGRRTKSEAACIRWDMINFPLKQITYDQTKTSKKNERYTFPLGPKAIEILQLIEKDRLNNPDSPFYFELGDLRMKYVFPSRVYGSKSKTPHVQTIKQTWSKLLKMAGVERKLKNYASRHTVGSIVIEETSDPNAVADILGTTVETALGYAATSQGKVRRILDQIDRKKTPEPLKIVK
jgi:integrase